MTFHYHCPHDYNFNSHSTGCYTATHPSTFQHDFTFSKHLVVATEYEAYLVLHSACHHIQHQTIIPSVLINLNKLQSKPVIALKVRINYRRKYILPKKYHFNPDLFIVYSNITIPSFYSPIIIYQPNRWEQPCPGCWWCL